MAHSPAPWHLHSVPKTTWIEDAEHNAVCEVTATDDYENIAALISAAPELLEACKALKAWRDKNDPIHTSYFYLEKIMDKVESAIAKAEGK